MREIKETFMSNIDGHQMTIIHDEGLSHHLKFRRSDSSAYWFNIVTWPGCLCINADMGTYVFARIDDMFDFFRDDKGEFDPGYLVGKLLANDCRRGSEGFSSEKLNEYVTEVFNEFVRRNCESADDPAASSLWEELKWEILHCDSEAQAHYAFSNFHFSYPKHEIDDSKITHTFEFPHRCDRSLTDYTYQYIWCCHAIVWAIQQYDKAKAEGVQS